MDTGESADENAQNMGLKRKAGTCNMEPPEEEDLDDSTEATDVVLSVLENHREVAARNTELEGKLQANQNTMRLLARHAGIPVDQVDDWIYARQMEQEQIEAAADASANVELHTPASGSSDRVDPVLIRKPAKGNTPEKAADSTKSKDKDKTPKGTKKTDLKSASSKSKRPRLEESLKERTSKELYAEFLESRKKSNEGQSGTKGAGSTRKDPAAKDKAGDKDSDAEVHEQEHGGDEEDENQFSDASEADQESDAESEDRGHRKGSDDLLV